jgi:two-component system sensor histidine kinase HydH
MLGWRRGEDARSAVSDTEAPTGERNEESRATLLSLSLRIKLLLFAALLVTVPGVVFGILAQQSGRDSLQRVIGRQLSREAGHTAQRLADSVESEIQTLRSMARQDVMREIRVDDIDKRISAALATLRDGSPARSDYLVADRSGRVVASSNPALIGPVGAWSALAATALAGGERVEGPAKAPGSPARSLSVATPIRDPDGEDAVIGALIGIYDWHALISAMRQVRDDLASLGLDTDVLLVRPGGAVVGDARSRSRAPGAAEADWSEVAAGTTAGPDYVVRPHAGLLIGRASLGRELDGWRLLIAEPLADALAPVRSLTTRLATTLGIILAAALVVAAVASERVARPLRELTRAIRGLPSEEGRAPLAPVRSQDEVGTLAAAFNQMASALDRAQRDLVEAAKFAFIGELAGGVAHEVRTSLGVLRSSAQILERSLTAEERGQATELAQMIRAEVDRLAGVVNDLLSLARPRVLRLEPTPLSEPLARAVELVEAQAAEKGIEILRVAGPSDPVVLCDAELLSQVALNLLVNAIQAQDKGGRIEVRTFVTREGWGAFEVSDQGPGIPEALRDKVFHPFVTGREGGVGLGLTFVKRVVHEHRGRIALQGGDEGGACFRIELPPPEASA